MLLYPGEGHGLGKRENAVDYERRILQWFAHYLKGEPAAKWITDGQSWLERKKLLDANKKEVGKYYGGPTWESRDGSSVIGCNANDSGNAANPNSAGITVGGGCTVRDCTTRNNTGNGNDADVIAAVTEKWARMGLD